MKPAFPQTIDDMGTIRSVTEGMSLRCYIATAAMQGSLTTREGMMSDEYIVNTISSSIKCADELLKQLEAK